MGFTRKPRKTLSGEKALGISVFMLNALKDTAALAPVPHVQEAAILAVTILEHLQALKDNNDGCKELAEYACQLVYSVDGICKENQWTGEGLTKDLADNLEQLVVTLEEINRLVIKMGSRNSVSRYIYVKEDAKKIQEYRERCTQALNIFWLQSSIHVRTSLRRLAEGQDILLADRLVETNTDAPSMSAGPDRLPVLSQIQYRHQPDDSIPQEAIYPPVPNEDIVHNTDSYNDSSIKQQAGDGGKNIVYR